MVAEKIPNHNVQKEQKGMENGDTKWQGQEKMKKGLKGKESEKESRRQCVSPERKIPDTYAYRKVDSWQT